ncbi:MAG: sulfatase-like hydrolase/transferase, partial [Eudoraea sp.]|nr:sulfatase-like hydrolase/transferase [Eudoraea sp.]
PYARKLKHAYLASVSYIDAQIGLLIKELEALELDKNTIIVIWGDHGWHLGDQQLWGKHTLFENALKSPLIIYSPYQDHKNNAVETIAETVDIYPTILELCGQQQQDRTDGQSLVPYMNSDKTDSTAVAYSYYKNGISVRTVGYRLTRYFREAPPKIELYDHTTDELESKNIAGEFPQLVEQLIPLLEQGNTGLYERK